VENKLWKVQIGGEIIVGTENGKAIKRNVDKVRGE
jgi:hypothetical protein